MKSILFLIASFLLLNTAYALSCGPPRTFLFDSRYLTNYAPGQVSTTHFPEVTMKGRCDVPYGKFHADLALYSLTREGYCQVYNRNPFLEDLTPADGTLLQGSQHVFESLGDRYASNLDEYGWDQQNFPVDINSIVMPCATYYYTDAATGNPTPPVTVCVIINYEAC